MDIKLPKMRAFKLNLDNINGSLIAFAEVTELDQIKFDATGEATLYIPGAELTQVSYLEATRLTLIEDINEFQIFLPKKKKDNQ